MSRNTPSTKLLLVEDSRGARSDAQPDYQGLQRQLNDVLGLGSVELTPYGKSTVYATVPARNQRDRERVKALLNEKVHGWKVIEEQSYSLPRTF